MNKVAILYICTGKYDVFWEKFFLSCEKYFLNNCEKHYYVFTDAEDIYLEEKCSRIHRIYQENLGWPGNTLKRFEIFYKIKDELEHYDYIFFMNANLLFVDEVNEEFLPIKEELLVVKHPGYFDKSRTEFTYEDNPDSLAYISEEEGEYYIAGGLNGGKATAYIKLIETLKMNIEEDLKHDIIAKWHDESHINRYILGRNDVKIIGPEYLYPEGLNLPVQAKVVIRDKRKWGGHDTLRGIKKKNIFEKILCFCKINK
jgi:hypothetical protein